MKKLFIIALLVAFIVTILPSSAAVKVKGYIRKDGTYVQPHYRSNPDGNFYNNWSSSGNYNPFTGQKGYKNQIPSINFNHYNNQVIKYPELTNLYQLPNFYYFK